MSDNTALMESSACVRRLILYPFKSLDGVEVSEAEILPSGALKDDRRWALFDRDGNVVNGKREPRIHRMRNFGNPSSGRLEFRQEDESESTPFRWPDQWKELEIWLSNRLGQPITIRENSESGFPDDTESPGPTLVSEPSLQLVAKWFDLSLDEVRRRFRANIELAAPEPFWEDRLVTELGATTNFRVGSASFVGVNPCQRCVVPTRDSQTGTITALFQREFARRRESSLPQFAPRSRFNHFYRLAVNTRVAVPTIVRVGDEVALDDLPRNSGPLSRPIDANASVRP